MAGAESGPDEWRDPLPPPVRPAGEARMEIGELRLVLMVPPFPVGCDPRLG